MHAFEKEFLFQMRSQHAPVLENLKAGKLVDSDLAEMKTVALDLAERYK